MRSARRYVSSDVGFRWAAQPWWSWGGFWLCQWSYAGAVSLIWARHELLPSAAPRPGCSHAAGCSDAHEPTPQPPNPLLSCASILCPITSPAVHQLESSLRLRRVSSDTCRLALRPERLSPRPMSSPAVLKTQYKLAGSKIETGSVARACLHRSTRARPSEVSDDHQCLVHGGARYEAPGRRARANSLAMCRILKQSRASRTYAQASISGTKQFKTGECGADTAKCPVRSCTFF
ncbi:hypothetical protein IWX49DRAFT_340563 [Phyllosticta citricarpa]|uniref:Uncharacterized protein n=1 Tax=Phyllosticta citricarpa TaxID=55181 RepID=A0ABR1MRL9_9PEZI